MKIHKFLKKIRTVLLPAIAAVTMFDACTEDIDMANRFTETRETILSYLENNDSIYSEYTSLLHLVPISSLSESSVAQLLSARGHYTCFAPTNEAIQLYLDSLQRKGIISTASWDGFPDEKSLDSIRRVIVYNSIIDGGDVKSFSTADFLGDSQKAAEFEYSNMNERRLTNKRGTFNSDSIFINNEFPLSMKHRDIETLNGYVHAMTLVIAPSDNTLADFFYNWAEHGGSNFTVMSKLILACGLADTLSATRDYTYENLYKEGKIEDLGDFKTNTQAGLPGRLRKYGFTIFAEKDSVWAAAIPEKEISEITVEDVKNFLIGKGVYPNATTDDNYTSADNIVNQFVTYHLLPERLSRNKLVIHWNEYGYSHTNAKKLGTATAEYYTTMGKRRLLKVYESLESNGIYLNRFPDLNNKLEDARKASALPYHESGSFKALRGSIHMYEDENQGILVQDPTGDDNVSPINGIFYTLDKFLVYTENVALQLQNQRIRFDVASMLPELMNNDLRRPDGMYSELNGEYRGFPTNYQYFNDIWIEEGTRFYYLAGTSTNWMNWQGDEFNIKGKYEFKMRLPPVPVAGHYELRLAVQSNSNVRGMCQVYWGSDMNNLPAAGIPLDMRLGGLYRKLSDGTRQPSIVGWVKDSDYGDDIEAITENDKTMRNNGFMKAPMHFCPTPLSTPGRDLEEINRRIIVSAWMEPDVTYYIKFKSVLEDTEKEHILDYMEYCSKEVYDNPNESEDIW
ncbi:MAG: fasciclin domain-containing protein [Bacteroidaceae bacterium]|nr:fasciclin domain-containing protein [Bacteroidaceae bacterium]